MKDEMPMSTDITAGKDSVTVYCGAPLPPPPPIGRFIYRTGAGENGWGVTTYQFSLYRKPKWITRRLLKWLFDVEWEWK